MPLLNRRKVTRGNDSPEFVTTYDYFFPSSAAHPLNDFGRPWQVIEEMRVNGQAQRTRTTTFVFDYSFGPNYIVDKIGSEKVKVDSESFTKSYTYDDNNDGFMTTQNIYGIETRFGRDIRTPGGAPGAVGLATQIYEAGNERTTFFEYDWGSVADTYTPLYRIHRVINDDGSLRSETRRYSETPQGPYTTSFEYDGQGRLTKRIPSPVIINGVGQPPASTVTTYDNGTDWAFTTVTSGAVSATTYLDGFGRTDWTLNGAGVKVDSAYDACGRRVYESYPYDDDGDPADPTIPNFANIGTTYTFDALSRVRRMTHPDANFVKFDFSNGIDVTITNERNKVTVQDFVAFGDPDETRLVRLTDADNEAWEYEYNALGSITSVDSPGTSPSRRWTYDTRGQLESEFNPESGTATFFYYENGLLKTRTDPEFGQTRHDYDLNGRLKTTTPPVGPITEYVYNEADDVQEIKNTASELVYHYDGAGRLFGHTDKIAQTPPFQVTTFYHRDGEGRVRTLQYPNGLLIDYDYDAAARVTKVRRGAASLAHTFKYHPSGAPLSFVLGNGKTNSFTYNGRYWPAQMNLGGIYELSYEDYDGVGNVRRIRETGRPDQNFLYDDLDRLTTANANGYWGSLTFDHHEDGSRKSHTFNGQATSYTYDTVKARLERFSPPGGAENYEYDNNGNLKVATAGSVVKTYGYTPRNMLETASLNGLEQVRYIYNGKDLRVRKILGTGLASSRFFLHGLGDQLLQEYEADCGGAQIDLKRSYVYAGSRLVAAVDPNIQRNATVQFVQTASTVGEGDSVSLFLQVTTANGQPTTCPVSVNYGAVSGSAIEGYDFASSQSGVVTIQAGQASGSILVTSLDDVIDEDSQSFVVTLSDPVGAGLGANTTHTITLTDDDLEPSVTIADATFFEAAGGTATVGATLSAPSERTISVSYVTVDGTALASRGDYVPIVAPATVVFAPGNGPVVGETVRPLPLNILEDLTDEDDQDFLVRLSAVSNVTVADGEARVWIVDDDGPSLVSVNDVPVTEPDTTPGTASFDVRLDRFSEKTIHVGYATADGTAVSAGQYADYSPASGTVVLEPDQTMTTIGVAITGDLVDEYDETFSMQLSVVLNVLLADSQGTATILDNDPPVQITVTPVTAGEAAGTAVVSVSLAMVSGKIVVVDYATTPQGARAGFDYTSVSGTLTFAPYATTPVQVTIPILQDSLDEPNEVFNFVLSNPQNGQLGTSSVWVTIADDDPPVEMYIDDATVKEGDMEGRTGTVTVRLSALSGKRITIQVSTANGSALEGVDYVKATRVPVVFEPESGTTQVVTVESLGDGLDDGGETFFLDVDPDTLPDPWDGQAILVDGRSTITITDDDPSAAMSAIELVHGSSWRGSIQGAGFVDGVDFRLSQRPYSSYEVVVEGGLHNGLPFRVRRHLEFENPLQVASAISPVGHNRSLRWHNATPYTITGEVVTVSTMSVAGCEEGCAYDTFRLRFYETTYAISRFNNTGGQSTVVLLQNPSGATVTGSVYFWDEAGALLGSTPFNIAAKGLLSLNTTSLAFAAGKTGSITIAHDGRFGELTGKAVGTDPATGFSFDTPMLPRHP